MRLTQATRRAEDQLTYLRLSGAVDFGRLVFRPSLVLFIRPAQEVRHW